MSTPKGLEFGRKKICGTPSALALSFDFIPTALFNNIRSFAERSERSVKGGMAAPAF